MKTQQMIEFLLDRMDANIKANKEDMLARMVAKIETNGEADREERKAENKSF
jgi:hypothetical protein